MKVSNLGGNRFNAEIYNRTLKIQMKYGFNYMNMFKIKSLSPKFIKINPDLLTIF